jgi:hypothetical protein
MSMPVGMKEKRDLSCFQVAQPSFQRDPLVGRCVMWRTLILGTLFAVVLVNPLAAQNKIGPNHPGGSEITYQWDYSCPSGGGECSFTCGSGGAGHVQKLGIYLGAMPVGTNQKNGTLFYEFTTRELRRGSGFSINTGLSTLQCQVNGLTVDYSGPPREGGLHIDSTGAISQNNK